MSVITLKVSDVVFKKEYYTRTESQSPAKVQEYATSIDNGEFPPILVTEVDGEYVLLDGWHRWMAHQKRKIEEIESEVLDTSSYVLADGTRDLFAIRRKAARNNFRHGQPQTTTELNKMIRDEYRAKMDGLDQKGRAELKKDMASDYSRSISYVKEVTSRIDKDLKAELRQTAFEMWLACHTQQEIADAVGYGQPAIAEFSKSLQSIINASDGENDNSSENDEREFEEEDEGDSNSLGTYKLDKRLMFKANHLDEHFKPPIYNIWKQQDRSEQVSHFGNSEITWLDNLLYLYTNPFDVVVDPFAGGGSTIDLCKTRLRRYMVSDRKPIDIRADIRQHDITEGVLAPPTWKDVALIYLDPPYWKQAENQYSQDATDLANMPIEQFNESLSGLIKQYAEKLKRAKASAYIALIIQPTQWSAPDREFTDHVGDMLRAVKLPVDMRFSVPYESQQCNAQMVQWAKDNRKCLVLSREIVVWRV